MTLERNLIVKPKTILHSQMTDQEYGIAGSGIVGKVSINNAGDVFVLKVNKYQTPLIDDQTHIRRVVPDVSGKKYTLENFLDKKAGFRFDKNDELTLIESKVSPYTREASHYDKNLNLKFSVYAEGRHEGHKSYRSNTELNELFSLGDNTFRALIRADSNYENVLIYSKNNNETVTVLPEPSHSSSYLIDMDSEGNILDILNSSLRDVSFPTNLQVDIYGDSWLTNTSSTHDEITIVDGKTKETRLFEETGFTTQLSYISIDPVEGYIGIGNYNNRKPFGSGITLFNPDGHLISHVHEQTNNIAIRKVGDKLRIVAISGLPEGFAPFDNAISIYDIPEKNLSPQKFIVPPHIVKMNVIKDTIYNLIK